MDPLTPLDTLCRIILRGREYEAQTASDYDRGEDADNIDDESAGTLSVLEDDVNTSVEEELIARRSRIWARTSWPKSSPSAGSARAPTRPSDWDEAMEEAQSLVSEGTEGAIEELMEQPMLASVLEAGLAAFDLSCDGIGEMS